MEMNGLRRIFTGLFRFKEPPLHIACNVEGLFARCYLSFLLLAMASLFAGSTQAEAQRQAQHLTVPLPAGSYRAVQGFKGTAYDSLFHLGKDYCVEASVDKTGVKLKGTRFYAIGSGRVVSVRFIEPAHRGDGVGNYITIDHGNGLVAIYMHLAQVSVHTGQDVTSDMLLGEAGDVILHPQPNCGHLHLEIRSNGITSLDVPPNLRFSYVSRDGKMRLSRPLGDERAVLAWIDANFLDPDRVLTSRPQLLQTQPTPTPLPQPKPQQITATQPPAASSPTPSGPTLQPKTVPPPPTAIPQAQLTPQTQQAKQTPPGPDTQLLSLIQQAREQWRKVSMQAEATKYPDDNQRRDVFDRLLRVSQSLKQAEAAAQRGDRTSGDQNLRSAQGELNVVAQRLKQVSDQLPRSAPASPSKDPRSR